MSSDYALLCPECKEITNKSYWAEGRDLHWTDSFGTEICPICKTETAEDLLLVKKIKEITADPAPNAKRNNTIALIEYKIKVQKEIIQNAESNIVELEKRLKAEVK